MRHYEVVFLVHPNQGVQVPEIIQRYKSIVESSNGKVHRLEDWGLRQLAYPINKSKEAHYVLMNIECTHEARKEITDSFQFSNAILRNLVLSRETPILEDSPIMRAMKKAEEDEKARKLKQSKEQDLLPADDAEVSPSKSDDEHSEAEVQSSEEKSEDNPAKQDRNNEEKPAKTGINPV